MKNEIRSLIKVDVLSSEPRLEHNSDRQLVDQKSGNKIWNVDIERAVYNEKHKRMTTAITTHKSWVELAVGMQVVELRVTSMAEGSGDFIKVKQFQTITRALDKNIKLGEFFSLDGMMAPLKTFSKGSTKSMTQ